MDLRLRSISLLTMLLVVSAAAEPPRHVYLTWQGETSTTMTVNYQTLGPVESSAALYDTVSRKDGVEPYAFRVDGKAHQLPPPEDGRYIHAAEITGLEPNTTYYAVAGAAEGSRSPEFSFRTAPSGDEPIHFVTGGDMDVRQLARDLLASAASRDPQFALIGGDLAYENRDIKDYAKWDQWLDNWEQCMIAPDGRMIPMVLAIGNHEVNALEGPSEVRAPFYYGYFAQAGGPSYFSRKFGRNVAVFALDSDHITPHAGTQLDWLKTELEKYKDVRYKFAVYHVPLYPSHREFMGGDMIAGRTHWAPMFDQYHLTAAFENHDHTHKRTPRIYNNRIDPSGTLYLGDGCFGQNSRTVDPERRWYEEVASPTPHFWDVKVTPDGVSFEAVNEEGKVFDSVTIE